MKAVISGLLSHYGMDTPSSQGSPSYWPADNCSQPIYQQDYNYAHAGYDAVNTQNHYGYNSQDWRYYDSGYYEQNYTGSDCNYDQNHFQYQNANGYPVNDFSATNNYSYTSPNYFVPSSHPSYTSEENSCEGYQWDRVS